MSYWSLISSSLFLLILISFLYSIHKKKHKQFIFSFLVLFLTVSLIKTAFKVERPILMFDYSYISMHASLAFLAFYFIREYLVLIIWPLLISISRLKLNLHRIEDVILGAIYGFFIPYLIDKNFKKFEINFEENKYYIFRKFLHIVFYLSFALLVFWPHIFLAYTVFSLVCLYIINLMKNEVLFDSILFKARKEDEDLTHTMIFPFLALLFFLIFENPWMVVFSSLTFAIGDGIVGILAVLTNNYFFSFLISNFYLFLITASIFDLKIGFYSALAFSLGDLVAKKLEINDNITIPLISFFISFYLFF